MSRLRTHPSLIQQSGAALVTVLMLSSVLLLLTSVSGMIVLGAQKDTSNEFRMRVQTTNVSRAGIQDAIGWFKRSGQTAPVANPLPASGDCIHSAFKPLYSDKATERDTDNEDIGIVKDLELDKGKQLYGRYIVRKQPCDVSEAIQRATTTTTQDMTRLRGKGLAGEGIVWRIVSEGVTYRRVDYSTNENGMFTLGPQDPPNQILSSSNSSVEIIRLNIKTPLAPITLLTTTSGGGNNSSFNSNCRVLGKGASYEGIYASSASPFSGYVVDKGGSSVAPPRRNTAPPPSEPLSVVDFFAVNEAEFRGVSDVKYSTIDSMPFVQSRGLIHLPMSIVYLDGNFTFDSAKPLFGTGVLYVNGNLTFSDNSGSIYSGMVYVKGTLSVGTGTSLSGAVVANKVTCTSHATIEYNPNILNTVRNAVGLYRENTLTYNVNQ